MNGSRSRDEQTEGVPPGPRKVFGRVLTPSYVTLSGSEGSLPRRGETLRSQRTLTQSDMSQFYYEQRILRLHHDEQITHALYRRNQRFNATCI